jgi:hypothetical protein
MQYSKAYSIIQTQILAFSITTAQRLLGQVCIWLREIGTTSLLFLLQLQLLNAKSDAVL